MRLVNWLTSLVTITIVRRTRMGALISIMMCWLLQIGLRRIQSACLGTIKDYFGEMSRRSSVTKTETPCPSV
ncbi:hypothetical protein BDW69DRAFT_173509 [Aspergillus filifer]